MFFKEIPSEKKITRTLSVTYFDIFLFSSSYWVIMIYPVNNILTGMKFYQAQLKLQI